MSSNFENIPECGDRYTFGTILGSGTFGNVYLAIDTQAGNKSVAIKVQKIDKQFKDFIDEEYKVLKELGSVIYLVTFYGIFKRKNEILFVLEYCEGGPVIDLVNGLLLKNRRMAEEHIAYVLKEALKGLLYLHENSIVHRDVKASNILLTKEGEVKLCDFGLSKKLKNQDQKLCSCVGSPGWMAPEVVKSSPDKRTSSYDNRCDVWALGITSIELGEGRSPYQDMHPTRALFQTVKNPPPTLQKVSIWSEIYHDFINECLVKTPENRPFIAEFVEHPFLAQIPENNYHLGLEIKALLPNFREAGSLKRPPEVTVLGEYYKKGVDNPLEKMLPEDLADLSVLNEDKVLELLEARTLKGENHTFIGDILLVISPNENINIYGNEFHEKYTCKSRSDNAPHIYSTADTAYQNALHHVTPQQIVLSGESGSGKTTNYLHLVDHLLYLGNNNSVNTSRMKHALKIIHALIHASTPMNNYSTRSVFKTNISYGKTGKVTGMDFGVVCIEKWRVSSIEMTQSNFHFLYYIYDGLVDTNAFEKYKLNAFRQYRYLRIKDTLSTQKSSPRYDTDNNIIKYKKILDYMKELEFSDEEISTILSIVSAILNIGEVRFQEEADGSAFIENVEYVSNVCELLDLDEKKFRWALTNYCSMRKGQIVRKKNTCDEARDARDVLANNLYARLVDYVVSAINYKLAVGKAIFGEKYTVRILDYFGFECFKKNDLPQLFVNCLNEQLQYHYVQRIFAWETIDLKEEETDYTPINYFDNRKTLDQLLKKPDGVMNVIDDASKKGLGPSYVMENLTNQETSRVMITNAREFSVAHFTGVVSYNIREMADKNRDFLPPEIVETMRDSQNAIVKILFTNKLNKTGNLCVAFEETKTNKYGYTTKKEANNEQYSQIRKMRTCATIFRALSLQLLRELSVGGSTGDTHFVRCVRANLDRKPEMFHKELVRQQLRALTVVETALARQNGFPHRVSFPEFLRRYKFLAFDFEENVEITRDNCRLLLLRLKMEDWAIGKSKVFLKYYNEEYLSRLYETKVKRIIKIQSILRGFLTKCRLKKKPELPNRGIIQRRTSVMTEEEAAEVIQRAYRKSTRRKDLGSNFELLGEEDYELITPFARKWRSHTMFHVLMLYRATKLQDFFNFSQQVHLYNQNAYFYTQKAQNVIDLDHIDQKARVSSWLGEIKHTVLKVPFRLDDIPFYDTSNLCDQLTNVGTSERDEAWDTPYRWRETGKPSSNTEENPKKPINIPFTRDPEEPIQVLPSETDGDEKIPSSIPICTKEMKEKENTIVSKKTPTNKSMNDQEKNISSPANKDFDFIRPSQTIPPASKPNPIMELREMAPKENSGSDDDPPYNFQGMLRKTNFKRDSMKNKALEAARRFSLPKNDEEKNDTSKVKNTALDAVRRFSLAKETKNEENIEENVVLNGNKDDFEPVFKQQVVFELVPGLSVEGIEISI